MKSIIPTLTLLVLVQLAGYGQIRENPSASSSSSPPAPIVTFLTGPELLRAIRSAPEEQPGRPGLYSLKLSSPSEYPVLGIRRTLTGRAERHAGFTDVWYVLQGTATLVTGGSIVDGEEIQPGEMRGRGIRGSAGRIIHAGGFAVIPAGVAHWIRDIKGKELLYIVVKVPWAKER
jgi:mannose-6-phosphate isomerase-like protein (cupin superfamily)